MGYRRVPRPHSQPAKGWRALFRRRRKAIAALIAGVIMAAVTTAVGFWVNRGLEEVASTGTPFTWSVRMPPLGPCIPQAVVGQAEAGAQPPDNLAELPAWADRVKAIQHANVSIITVTLQGKSDTAVVLQAMRVRVVNSVAPPMMAFTVGGGCGGPLGLRMFEVVLDRPLPRLQAYAGGPPTGSTEGPDAQKSPAVSFPYKISVTDPEVFEIKANAGPCDCEWIVELDWASKGKSGTTRIDNQGHTFRTISTTGKPSYVYDGHIWSRLPASPP